jgi:hypothetical protein
MAASLQHNTSDGLRILSSQGRKELLGGPSILLIVSHSGTSFNYAHQCSAAEGVVSTDRSRQLAEETESGHRPFSIEFPIRALCAASSAFREGYKTSPDIAQVSLDMGNILPGYAMCVLDWLTRALSSNHWIDFLPPDAPVANEDKWYWIYCYSAMRTLRMDSLAQPLRDFVMRLINIKTLILDRENYVRLLTNSTTVGCAHHISG